MMPSRRCVAQWAPPTPCRLRVRTAACAQLLCLPSTQKKIPRSCQQTLTAQGCRKPLHRHTEHLHPSGAGRQSLGKHRLTEARHTCDCFCFWSIYCKPQVAALSCLSHWALWPVLHSLRCLRFALAGAVSWLEPVPSAQLPVGLQSR